MNPDIHPDIPGFTLFMVLIGIQSVDAIRPH